MFYLLRMDRSKRTEERKKAEAPEQPGKPEAKVKEPVEVFQGCDENCFFCRYSDCLQTRARTDWRKITYARGKAMKGAKDDRRHQSV